MQPALSNPDSVHRNVPRFEIFSRASSDASMRVNLVHDNDYLILLYSKIVKLGWRNIIDAAELRVLA
jgi:hypothetical protein